MKHSIKISVMALVAMFVLCNSANAQLGGLKGLANKAKKAIKDKVTDTTNSVSESATNSVSSTAGSSAGTDNDGGKVEVSLADFDVDYSIAKKTDWTYNSPTEDVIADVAYWLQRLRNSLSKGNYNAIDFEALGRINNGLPSFSFVDEQYHQTASARNLQAVDNFRKEKDQLLDAAWKIISAKLPEKNDWVGKVNGLLSMAENATNKEAKEYFFDRAFEVTSLANKFGKISQGSSDESQIASRLQTLYAGLDDGLKGNYPSSFKVSDFKAFDAKRTANGAAAANAELQKMRKGSLLTMYKYSAANNRYRSMPASKGNAAEKYIRDYVTNNYPEWGKIVSVSCPEDWAVERNALGKPIYRHYGASILCEDQGYKVLHGISMHQDYEGGKYSNSMPRNDQWNRLVDLVK